jgi:hypothetical protein
MMTQKSNKTTHATPKGDTAGSKRKTFSAVTKGNGGEATPHPTSTKPVSTGGGWTVAGARRPKTLNADKPVHNSQRAKSNNAPGHVGIAEKKPSPLRHTSNSHVCRFCDVAKPAPPDLRSYRTYRAYWRDYDYYIVKLARSRKLYEKELGGSLTPADDIKSCDIDPRADTVPGHLNIDDGKSRVHQQQAESIRLKNELTKRRIADIDQKKSANAMQSPTTPKSDVNKNVSDKTDIIPKGIPITTPKVVDEVTPAVKPVQRTDESKLTPTADSILAGGGTSRDVYEQITRPTQLRNDEDRRAVDRKEQENRLKQQGLWTASGSLG